MADEKVVNLELLASYDAKLKKYIEERIKEVETSGQQSTISLPSFSDTTV